MTEERFRRLALCIGVVLVLAACGPPPSGPPLITGSPTVSLIVDGVGFVPPGFTLPCTVKMVATVSLIDDTSAQVITKAYTGGPCPPTAWLFNGWLDCHHDCGSTQLPLSATTLITTNVDFARAPDFGYVDFRVWASLAGQTATSHAASPQIRCDGARCYFQVPSPN